MRLRISAYIIYIIYFYITDKPQHFNLKYRKYIMLAQTSKTLVWQARAIEKIGKHCSMPAELKTWIGAFS